MQVAIVPIWKSEEERGPVSGVGGEVKAELARAGIRVELDLRDNLKPGAKYFEWEAKGVPLRLEIGPRDVAAGQVVAARRTGGKSPLRLEGIVAAAPAALQEIQAGLFATAKQRREEHSLRGATKQQFLEFMKGSGGFAYAGFCGGGGRGAALKAPTPAPAPGLPPPQFPSPRAAQAGLRGA